MTTQDPAAGPPDADGGSSGHDSRRGGSSGPPAPREATIPEQRVFASTEGRPFPLVLTPPEGGSAFGPEAWAAWAEAHRAEISGRLAAHGGALLFRGFPLATAGHFDAFCKALGGAPLPYVGGAAPRTLVAGDVFTTNEAPPEAVIPFHHEMAQVPKFPSRVAFFAERPPGAGAGGETPILPSHEVYLRMREKCPAFVAELEARGLRYTRVLPDGDDAASAIGRGWQSTYGTEDRAEAEAKCRSLGGSCEWLPSGDLKTVSSALPATRRDPLSGRPMWFNSMVAAYTGWKDSRNVPELAVTFGDGAPLDRDAVLACDAIMQEIAVAIPWQARTAGDVILLDNRTAMHARRPFVGPRRILAYLFA